VSRNGSKSRRRNRRSKKAREVAAKFKKLSSFEGLNERIKATQKRADLSLLKVVGLIRQRDEKYHPDGTLKDDTAQEAA